MVFNIIQKLNLKNKIIAALISSALVFFFLIYFIVVPTINDIKTMSNEIENQRIDLEKRYIRGNSLRQLNENLKKIEPKLSLLDKIFINKNRELEFITTLEREAAGNQIKQKINLSSPKVTANQDFHKSGFQLYSNGKFRDILKYLISLESLVYYINVKSLELTPSIDASIINMLISSDTYWNKN